MKKTRQVRGKQLKEKMIESEEKGKRTLEQFEEKEIAGVSNQSKLNS